MSKNFNNQSESLKNLKTPTKKWKFVVFKMEVDLKLFKKVFKKENKMANL